MKTYHGWRDTEGTAHVVIIDNGGRNIEALPLRLDLDNHSPTGFEWGYGGSGPAQLALALLADVLNDDDLAVKLHQRFKWKHIATIDRNTVWRMTPTDVLAAITAIENEEKVS